ncbi:MAG: ArnT family glycosyltransferase, partial [Planctomycetota bacterium]
RGGDATDGMDKALPRWLSAVVWIAFVVLGFAGCFYIAWYSITAPSVVIAGIGLGLFALLAWLTRRVARLAPPAQRPPESASRRALIPILVLGVAVRIAWVAAFPPAQYSDGAAYVGLAKGIVDPGEYVENVNGNLLRAWRPPGYPAFLAPFYALLGDVPWIPALANVLLYLASAILLHDLGVRLSGPRAGRLAAILLTVWPAGVLITGLALTETLTLFLCLAFYACWLRVLEGRAAWAPVLGIVAAASAFVRPTLLPVPLLLVAMAAFLRPFRVRAVTLAILASIVMAAVIAPWAIRNQRTLGGFVPISTNGGDVFYRANNPLATGSWTPKGEVDLWQHASDELSWNKAGYRLGKEWIAQNPGAFLKLAAQKQAILLGTDGFAPYYALTRGCGISDARHDVAAVVCNVWWAAFWILAVLGAVRARDAYCRTPFGVAALLMVFALVAAHSIFESQPRHHVAFFGFLALLAAFLFHPPVRQEARVTA